MNENKISAALAAQAVTNINAALATIRENLPFLLNLTAKERKSLPSITEETQGVVLAALNFTMQHPEALPATFDSDEFKKDGDLLTPFQQVASSVDQLNTDINDTLRALHGDLYGQFLDVYAFAKANNRSGGYDAFIDSVKGRFAKGPRKPPTTPA